MIEWFFIAILVQPYEPDLPELSYESSYKTEAECLDHMRKADGANILNDAYWIVSSNCKKRQVKVRGSGLRIEE